MKKEEKQEETKPIPWEVTDPKPPVIRSGHMEQRKANEKPSPEGRLWD